jgi:two-component system cell cycle sensor histidine kinase/response regulator CckA
MTSVRVDGFFCLASDGTIEECNQKFCELTGYSREELLSMRYCELAPSETVDRLHERLSGAADRQGAVYVIDYLRKDGLRVPLETALAFFHGAEFPHFAGFARPVEANAESPSGIDRRYRDLVESLPQIVFETDEQGNLVFANGAAFRAFGYGPEALVAGFNVLEVFAPEDASRAERDFRQALAGENRGPNDYRVLRKDGSSFEVLIYCTPIIRGGRPCGLRGVMVDISDSRSIERQLRKLSAAVEQSPVSVIITDAAANIEYVNRKFTEVTGYSREEVIGKNPRILKSGEMPEEVYRDLWSKISSGREWRGELLNRRKNGELYWEFASISPMRGPDGAITNYIGVKEEITERKRLEQQLIQARKMEAIGRLAGGIAHDFNNLLTVITGYSDLLSSRLPPGSPERVELDEIRKAGEKAASLTSQLLAFSRKQLLRAVPMNLNDCVGNVLKMLDRLIGENVELATALEPRLGLVRADPTQMEQVILNLAVNARDAMPEGGRLSLCTANVYLDQAYARAHNVELASGPYVMLAVSDTGKGMDAETRARLFEPFFTTKDAGKGTGLGLCTVYGIVKQSGGYVWVYSEPGHGTTFKVYLPRIEETEPRAHARVEGARALGGSETILLVEDNEALRKLCLRALAKYGYKVIEAASAEEALEQEERSAGSIDLLLTDVVLPGTSGKKLAELLRARRPGIRVLYSSGYPEDTLSGGTEEGAQFLQKPFSPEMLVGKVRELLDAE